MLPSGDDLSGSEGEKRPISCNKRSVFNTFYNVNAVYTAKIQCNGITFGTVFVCVLYVSRFIILQTKQ